jgi:hypothetical protein
VPQSQSGCYMEKKILIEFTQICLTVFTGMQILEIAEKYYHHITCRDPSSLHLVYPVGFRIELSTRL